MITISPPHAALNDPRQHKRFRMRYSYVVGATESVADMAARLDRAASLTPRGVLANVVVCAHGSPDSVQLGAGLTRSSVTGFSSIRGKVRKIWLTSCRTASTSTPGRSLPARLASAAGCYVVAATETQLSAQVQGWQAPYGRIGDYEGLVLTFGPSGQIVRRVRYASAYQDSNGRWHRGDGQPVPL